MSALDILYAIGLFRKILEATQQNLQLLTYKYLCISLSSGPPDPNKSVFVRHSSTVVCTAGIPHSLAIEPRDEFNNLCLFHSDENPTEGYNVAITQVTVHQKFALRYLNLFYEMVIINTSCCNFIDIYENDHTKYTIVFRDLIMYTIQVP